MDPKTATILSLIMYTILFIGTIVGEKWGVITPDLAGVIFGGIMTHFGIVGNAVAVSLKNEKGGNIPSS
jgi:hypothetical protein